MKAKMFRALLPLAIVFTMVSCSSDTTEDNAVDKQVVTTYSYNDTELKLFQLINDYRASLGKNRLEVINHISYKSEGHNEYMIDQQALSHDYFQERANNLIQVLDAERVSENVAYNYNTAESAFAAWKNSTAHRQNMEGDYTHFGISVTSDPQTGKKYYTNIFIKKE